MSNLSKLEFLALDISGKTYLSWVRNEGLKMEYLTVKAMIFLHHHLDEGLKMEYLTVKDPLVLWNNLKDRYDLLKLVVFPQARYD